jgi:hypothetical protein
MSIDARLDEVALAYGSRTGPHQSLSHNSAEVFLRMYDAVRAFDQQQETETEKLTQARRYEAERGEAEKVKTDPPWLDEAADAGYDAATSWRLSQVVPARPAVAQREEARAFARAVLAFADQHQQPLAITDAMVKAAADQVGKDRRSPIGNAAVARGALEAAEKARLTP